MTSCQEYVETAFRAGCPRSQIELLGRAEIVLQPRQLAASAVARLCDHPDGPMEIGYGGARGGGKSHWLLAQIGADDCQRFSGLKGLLLRKVGKANLEHFEDLRKTVFHKLPHHFSPHRGILTFRNQSRIVAGHFQCESDIDAYLGIEYDFIGIEEATTLSARKFHDILTCLRSSKTMRDGRPWRPRCYSTTNPGGIGHAWYKARLVDPYLLRQERLTRFIPARVADNRFNNPEYAKILANLTGWQRRAWLDGDWDIAAGQFFTQFRREIHVVDDFDDTRAHEWLCALDYGYTHYTAVVLGCRDCDGNLFIVDEYAERLRLPQVHAQSIFAMLRRHGVGDHGAPLRLLVAGADVFSRQSDGTTVAGQYAALGLTLKCACTDRINGWAEILHRLGDPESGVTPRLFFHRRCARLIECLSMLQHDPSRPEDVLKVDADEEGLGGDDLADALRYLVATTAAPPATMPKPFRRRKLTHAP